MTSRALVIAIEEYNAIEGGGMARRLPRTLSSALAFKDWLETRWRAEGREPAATDLQFLSEPVQPGGARATRDDVLAALTRLRDSGANTTEEFFFFFSGHGFQFVEKPGNVADTLVTSDFRTLELSGHCGLKLGEIVRWMRAHLGPGRHFYFVDACRNRVDGTKVQVGPLLPHLPRTTAEATAYILQSTASGATAASNARFFTSVLEGLGGAGSAKVWKTGVDDAMFVRFESLRLYVENRVAQHQPISWAADGTSSAAGSDDFLARLSPVPTSKCVVEIRGSESTDCGSIEIERWRPKGCGPQPLTIPETTLSLEPDDYRITVKLQEGTVLPAGPVEFDLYEDRRIVFQKSTPGSPADPVPPSPGSDPEAGDGPEAVAPDGPTLYRGSISVDLPLGSTLEVRDVCGGEIHRFEQSGSRSLRAGGFVASLLNRQSQLVRQLDFKAEPGKERRINLAKWETSIPHKAIARTFRKTSVRARIPSSFSVPSSDPDLDVWLAVLGASRIFGLHGKPRDKEGKSLRAFGAEPAHSCALYVIAGFERKNIRLRLASSRTADVVWDWAGVPRGLSGVREWHRPSAPGSQLVSLQVGRMSPYTLATACLPNRVTLITLTLDEAGIPSAAQYLLPYGHLLSELPPRVGLSLDPSSLLEEVRFLARMSRDFRHRRVLAESTDEPRLAALLGSKWLDPIGSSMAAYELIRRGKATTTAPVVQNMIQYFPELPDTWALARLGGSAEAPARGVPLFMDGYRAVPECHDVLPNSFSRMNFAGMWTSWWGAVHESESHSASSDTELT